MMLTSVIVFWWVKTSIYGAALSNKSQDASLMNPLLGGRETKIISRPRTERIAMGIIKNSGAVGLKVTAAAARPELVANEYVSGTPDQLILVGSGGWWVVRWLAGCTEGRLGSQRKIG